MDNSEFNWPQIGNEPAIEFLSKNLKNKKIAQAYIFIGSDDLGKSTIALAFARNLQGNPQGFNSDLHILKPEEDKKSISIEQVREFIKILNLSSFLNSYKIGVIKQADLLTPEAQNALLKTLEEPQDKVIIILLVDNEENLPKTILSRSQLLYFQPVPAAVIYDYLLDNYKVNRSLAKDLANLSLGRPLKAIRLLENADVYKDYLHKAEVFLTFFTANPSDRWRNLDQIFTDKSYSVQAVNLAREILAIGEGLGRDLLLLSLGQPERVQHSMLSNQLEKVLQIITDQGTKNGSVILERLKLIAQAKEYLESNVNPRLVLEQLIVNL